MLEIYNLYISELQNFHRLIERIEFLESESAMAQKIE